jgi:hypothetical protein
MSDGHGYQEVFQSMSSQCLVLPELFYAAAIDIGPRIPPLKNKYAFLSDTVKSHGSLDLSFYYDQGVVISKPSFTVEIHSNAYLLFLIPSFISWVDMSWLFFNCHQDPVQWQPSLLSLLCLAMTDSGGVSGVSTLHILAHHSVAHVHLKTSLNIMLLNIGYLVAEVQLKGILSVMLATSIFHDYVQLSEYHEFFNLLETVKWSVARQCSSVEVLLKTVYMESVTGIVGHIILVQRKCGGLVFSLLWLPPACEQFVHWILWEIPWLFSALVNWSSDVLAIVAVITSASMLLQSYPSRLEFALQGTFMLPDTYYINWVHAFLSTILDASLSKCRSISLNGDIKFQCSVNKGQWLSMLSEIIQLCFSCWLVVKGDWATEQLMPQPWPPPVQCVLQDNGFQIKLELTMCSPILFAWCEDTAEGAYTSFFSLGKVADILLWVAYCAAIVNIWICLGVVTGAHMSLKGQRSLKFVFVT